MSTAPKYRKKPVEIEAVLLTPDNAEVVADWCGGCPVNVGDSTGYEETFVMIPTLEGQMRARAGDYVIRGIKGEFYPCKPDIFAATHEAVPE